ncbi:unnamed protein product [Plutella xylostella]|uniref:(diamondback moth) hypothetical protein n=1 Tax=Plutella xylostella TaxID=51655 RepID=A0A8S4GCU3_PLUXY|nr:unnamed protein product [Plutella xylostella]
MWSAYCSRATRSRVCRGRSVQSAPCCSEGQRPSRARGRHTVRGPPAHVSAEASRYSRPPAAVRDSDLREHVVGILFAGHQLTCLQRQVMSHIVCAIGCEAARARDDWETALVCEAGEQGAGAGERGAGEGAGAGRGNAHVQDSYCFEMLSLLLALSGSAVGRAHLAQRTELLADLLSLLHTGSERVQRQVISLLRRMIAEIPPQKMLAAINYGSDMATRVTLLDHLVSYLSKAITVQLKVKAFGAPPPSSITMGGSVAPAPPAAWFMRGSTTNKHAHLVAKLLCDMAEDKVSPTWTAETVTSLTSYVTRLATLSEAERAAARCVAAPAMWLALAALCVCQQSQLDRSVTTSATSLTSYVTRHVARPGRAVRVPAVATRQVSDNLSDLTYELRDPPCGSPWPRCACASSRN